MSSAPAWRALAIDEGRAAALARTFRLRPLTARVLLGRTSGEDDVAARFLNRRLADLRPPEGMLDLDRALERLVAALGGRERIGIFGDYDVDGVTTAAILVIALRAFGGDVVPRVASRQAGYGLGIADVGRFAADGCRVIVTGDCGTSDFDALRAARDRGIDTIVIDHHQVPSGDKLALALINPHQGGDRFPFKGLASCGVAFYLSAALRTRLREAGSAAVGEFDPRSLLDLVALGTIADMVPLVDENRILVAAGLRALGERRRPAIRELAALGRMEPGPMDAHEVSFKLTPRLNAAGRLGEAQLSLDLLLAASDAEAARLARDLDDVNAQRQRIQDAVMVEALAAAAEQAAAGAPAIVVGAEGWHRGVVGIVAAKLVERHGRPAVVVGFDGDEGRGSARTVPGFDLYRALGACRDHLERFGGHAGAAGVTVRRDRFEAFRRSFFVEAERGLPVREGPTLDVDAVADLGDLDTGGVEDLARLAPFGQANPAPLLALRGVTARSTRVVGENHLQLTLAAGGAVGDAIAFGMATADPGAGAAVDLLAHAEVDVFRGNRRARLRVKHLYRAGGAGPS